MCVKPGEEIRLVKENLAFAVSLWKAATAGRIPPEPVLHPPAEGLRSAGYGRVGRPAGEGATELVRGASNQMRGAFALAALQAQRSMARAFPGEPIQEPWPELRCARSVVYLAGLAVQRSILQPVWECPQPYRRQFQIRRIGFNLNAIDLEGRVMSWDDFGGLERYLSLLEYCAASAAAAGDAGSDWDSRTLPGRLASPGHYDGVIGSPAARDDASAVRPHSAPPRGYPGDGSERPLAPDVPPFAPPRPDGLANDGWDTAAEEQTGQRRPEHEAQPPQPYEEAEPASEREGVPKSPAPVQSLIQRFIAERCETGDDERILAGELYADFVEWCAGSGYEPVSQRAFGMRLTGLGLTRKRRGHGKHWWVGIGLAATGLAGLRTGTSG